MTRLARLTTAVLLALTAFLSELPGEAATAAVGGGPNTLLVGDVVRPGEVGIVSSNQTFSLSLGYNASSPTSGYAFLEIDQRGTYVTGGLWIRSGLASSEAYATMQTDGNFVLYAKPGVAVWSTHTAGTGSNNRLVMRDDGNLAVYTSSGRVVWASGTQAGLLDSGDRLLPGQSLRNVYSQTEPPTTLTMQKDGNLVVTFRGVIVWASNTSVPGSSLLMQSNGDLVIQYGSRILWRSGTARLRTPADGTPFVDLLTSGHFAVSFTPPSATGGPAETYVFDSAHRPGESGRTTGGDLRVMTTSSVLRPRQALVSGDGFRLTMQADGNLVLRGPRGTVRWQTNTRHHRGAILRLRTDGRLVVQKGTRVLWRSRKSATDFAHSAVNLVLQSNGRAVAHGPTGLRVWVSPRR